MPSARTDSRFPMSCATPSATQTLFSASLICARPLHADIFLRLLLVRRLRQVRSSACPPHPRVPPPHASSSPPHARASRPRPAPCRSRACSLIQHSCRFLWQPRCPCLVQHPMLCRSSRLCLSLVAFQYPPRGRIHPRSCQATPRDMLLTPHLHDLVSVPSRRQPPQPPGNAAQTSRTYGGR